MVEWGEQRRGERREEEREEKRRKKREKKGGRKQPYQNKFQHAFLVASAESVASLDVATIPGIGPDEVGGIAGVAVAVGVAETVYVGVGVVVAVVVVGVVLVCGTGSVLSCNIFMMLEASIKSWCAREKEGILCHARNTLRNTAVVL